MDFNRFHSDLQDGFDLADWQALSRQEQVWSTAILLTALGALLLSLLVLT